MIEQLCKAPKPHQFDTFLPAKLPILKICVLSSLAFAHSITLHLSAGDKKMPVIVEGKTYELISKVAEQFGVTIPALRRASERGLIPFIKVGRHRLIDVEAAQRFITTQYKRTIAQAQKQVWARRRKRMQAKVAPKGEVNEDAA
jgi:excisionase family DNA binding protein